MNWPTDHTEFAKAAREIFIAELESMTAHWINHATDLLTNRTPAVPHERAWSAFATRDGSLRKAFGTLTPEQRGAVLELIRECVSGAVFGCLCTLDQFPGGEAEVWVRDGTRDDGARAVKIAPTDLDLHDEYRAPQSTWRP